MIDIFIIIASFIISIVLVIATKHLSISQGIHDIPNGRKIHEEKIPTMGGLAIFSTIWTTFFALDIFNIVIFDPIEYKIFALSTAFLMLGIVDDVKGLSAKYKFIVQIISSIVFFLWINNYSIVFFNNNFITSIILCLFFIFVFVFLTNSINFIDGLDGLCAGVSIIFAILLLVISIQIKHIMAQYMLIALIGSLFGFIIFNFSPATIFMGDTGSLFLGGMFAMIGIMLLYHIPDKWFIFIILFTYLAIDMMLTIIRRIIKGYNIFKADKNHIHHVLMRLTKEQRKTVLIIYGFNIIYAVLSYMYFINISIYIVLSLYIGISLFLIIFFLKKTIGYN